MSKYVRLDIRYLSVLSIHLANIQFYKLLQSQYNQADIN